MAFNGNRKAYVGLHSDLDRLQTSYQRYTNDEGEDDDDEEAPPGLQRGGGVPWTHGLTGRGANLSPKDTGGRNFGDEGPGGVIIHTVPENSKSRWSHIEDLDSFFKKIYKYHQKHGFYVMMTQECLELVQFLFMVSLTLFLFECVNYPVLFGNQEVGRESSMGHRKVLLSDAIEPMGECVAGFSLATWVCLLLATCFWATRAVATFYHFFQFWDIKSFYNVALKITDSDLDSITWQEVQKRLVSAQEEYLMCIHKEQLSELDIYHRILRFRNYMVALVNKDLLPVKITIPCVGEHIFLSHGLKYNFEFLLFRGPWAPFNQWHLKEDFKRVHKKKELVEQLQRQITLLAVVNFLLMPLVLLWQLLYSFFSYVELIKREPGSLGVRKWNQYARIYLRHFNELDHEFRGRLNRAYKPANMYMELFVSPLSVVVSQNVVFMAGSVLAVFIVLTVWDEDVLNVEHVLTIMTALGALVAFCRIFIPDENLVFCPERILSAVLAHIHYFPDAWKGQAHTQQVMSEVGQLFPYTAVYLLQELLSPIITPFVLYFNLRPKAPAIVDFFRNFTVDVVGVGDVCSFAQMDVRKHGNPQWQANVASPEPCNAPKANTYTQAEDGKTEMSLVHFTLVNPQWKPPQASEEFIRNLRGQMEQDAEALPVLPEENLADNAVFSSLNSLDAVGGMYASVAANVLAPSPHMALGPMAGVDRLQQSFGVSSQAAASVEAGDAASSAQMDSASAPTTRSGSGSILQGVQQSLAIGRSSMLASSHFPQLQQNEMQPLSLFGSRFASTLAPPPNLKQDLRRLGLDFTEADMSFSALYLHEMHNRMNVGLGSTFLMSRRSLAEASRYDFQLPPHGSSLHELEEETLPLVEAASPPAFHSAHMP